MPEFDDSGFLDLRLSAAGKHNGPLAEMLQRLAAQARAFKATGNRSQRQQQSFRATQFENAARSIEALPYEVRAVAQVKGIPGIGLGILRRIDEFLRTGELSELKATEDPDARSIIELTRVHGIGEVTAQELLSQGIRSIDDLRKLVQDSCPKVGAADFRASRSGLPNAVLLGIKHFDDMQIRIPREEIRMFDEFLQANFDDGKAVICGSYRRRKLDSGDVDVLLVPNKEKAEVGFSSQEAITELGKSSPSLSRILERFLSALSGDVSPRVVDVLARSDSKFMGFVRLVPGGVVRRLDVRVVTSEQFPLALTYFTGSQKFNVTMRKIALVRRFSLNEYQLTGPDGSPVAVRDERELFRLLGIKYLEPWERDL
ncbi:MAG: type-X family DNA polymerase [Sulfobacillus sp.]